MNLLFIGDIVGDDALKFLVDNLGELKEKYKPDVMIANGENIWNGKGLNEQEANVLFDAGFSVITTGNHIWENWKSRPLLASNGNVLRPLNYPSGNPGKGYTIIDIGDIKIGVIQLQGRTFMQSIDCPFKAAENAFKNIKKHTNNIFVDFHAEATAEKMAFAKNFDGEVTAIVGTHTHIPTADSQIMPKGTAYISDVGMTGPHDSVIGMDSQIAIRRYILQTAHKYEMATDDMKINGVSINFDEETGQAYSIEHFTFPKFINTIGV